MAAPENILHVAKDNKAKKKAIQEEGKMHKAEAEKQDRKAEKPLFPVEGKINKYGFIYLSGEVLAAFGLGKGAEHKLTVNLDDDKLIIRKV